MNRSTSSSRTGGPPGTASASWVRPGHPDLRDRPAGPRSPRQLSDPVPAELDERAELERLRAEVAALNDGACDPQGRFWAGSMAYETSPGAGTLYRMDPDGTVTAMVEEVTISSGLGRSRDGGTMYYADSGAGTLDAVVTGPPATPYRPLPGVLPS